MMEELSPNENVLLDETVAKINLSKVNGNYNQTIESNESGFFNESSRLHALELEQEQLNASLMALTTHFGQVQFRLRQIVVAPESDKEHLLRELEEFAFKGCPVNNSVNNYHENIIQEQRLKQKDLIFQLKGQLEDIQSYTLQVNLNKVINNYLLHLKKKSENVSDVPSIIEKQRIIIDELKEKINLPLENLDTLNSDELKKVVDKAINQIVNPAKVKEQLVGQLKTQIEDLERFIDFLQGEASSPGPYLQKKNCTCSKNCDQQSESAFPVFNQPQKNDHQSTKFESNQSNQSTVDILKKILSVMQMFAISQLNCGSKNIFEKNSLKKTSNHWGDLRANLELAINKILIINSNYNESKKVSLYENAESDDEISRECPNELVRAIRKDFACSLRDLMQHGLIELSNSSSIVPFGCFVARSKESGSQMHIWDLLIKYFDAKHGKEFTQSAANKLSQSFSLNVVGGKVITIKQSLLNSIEKVLKIHGHNTTNKDSCFKAFVCLAINEKKLALYLKQILKATVIIENYYQNWSYIKTTGFDDALKSIDQLKCLNWNIPVEKSKRRKSTKTNDLF